MSMERFIGQKVLATTVNWFVGPDGKTYRAVQGTLTAVHEAGKTMGFIPNRSHANWYYEIGGMIIMGCQIMYLILASDTAPDEQEDYSIENGEVKKYTRPTSIYQADKI